MTASGVDVTRSGGMFVPSPAPGQQALGRSGRPGGHRAASAGRQLGCQSAQAPVRSRGSPPCFRRSWIWEGPRHPVDNEGESVTDGTPSGPKGARASSAFRAARGRMRSWYRLLLPRSGDIRRMITRSAGNPRARWHRCDVSAAETRQVVLRQGSLTSRERRTGPLGRVAVIIPTYNERDNLGADRHPDPDRCSRRRHPGGRRQQPGRHRRDRRQAGGARRPRSRAAPRRARPGSAPLTSPASTGGWSAVTACWSSMTPTARTTRRICLACSALCKTPTWSSAPGTCRAARS